VGKSCNISKDGKYLNRGAKYYFPGAAMKVSTALEVVGLNILIL